ncbi:MAG TPA: DUF5677 domain-containing protein [Acidobacteriaceae bacterium]|nr:DUF5677 domain-containing protein [Acidobacteriaceae bacterium]
MRLLLVDPTDLDLVHEAFKAEMADGFHIALTKVIVDKLYKQGTQLSRSEISELLDLIRKDPLHPSLPVGRNARLLDCHIELNEQDMRRVERHVDRLEKNAPKIFEKRATQMARLVLRDLKKSWPQYSRREQRDVMQFEKRLRTRWKKPLSTMRHFLVLSRQLVAGFRTRIDSDPARSMLWEVLTRSHARAIRTSEEIYCLLASGFADGALSRWRTLHELAVVSHFLVLHGEDVAVKYFDHHLIATKKRMDELATPFWAQVAAQDATFTAEHAKVKSLCDSLLQKHGSSFGTDYGWAADALQKSGVPFGTKGPNFRQIEDAVGAGRYRAHYQWASADIYASPKGTYTREAHDFPSVHMGPTNMGLDVAGVGTVYLMAEMMEDLVSLYPSMDAVFTLKMLNKLAVDAERDFGRCKKQLEAAQRAAGPMPRI